MLWLWPPIEPKNTFDHASVSGFKIHMCMHTGTMDSMRSGEQRPMPIMGEENHSGNDWNTSLTAMLGETFCASIRMLRYSLAID